MLQRTLIIIAVFSLAGAGLSVAHPGQGGENGNGCGPETVFENEDVRLWFHGMKGFVKVFNKNEDGNGYDGMYEYMTLEIAELDADNGTHAWMNLERAYPQTSSCEIEETDEFVNMSITITDSVHERENGGIVGDATVTFAWHWNKTAQGAKFDLFVDSWPWQLDDSELAFGFNVHTEGYTIESAENGLGFRDENNETVGYIEWAPNATAEYEDGHNETAIVDSYTENDGSSADVQLRFTNATAGYTFLEYDPWVGVGDYIIVGPLLIGLAPVEQALPPEAYAVVRGLLL